MTTIENASCVAPAISREPGKPPILSTPTFDDMTDATSWLTANRTDIRAELLRSGCLMVRGLPVASTDDFAVARDILIPKPASYKEKATPRSDFGSGVFSSTDLPAVQPIRLHNENSYTLDFPGVLMFGCLIAPDEGGATTVGDMRKALAMLPEDLRTRCERAGWLLVRNFSEMAGLPWHKSFATTDRSVVDAYCQENMIGVEWLSEDELRSCQRRSAIVTHPVTGERSWFNHMAFWNSWTLDPDIRDVLVETYGEDGLPFATYVGDGTPLTQTEAAALNAVYDEVTVRESWQQGDLMLVDNILCAHGREAFSGNRKIVVAMGEPVALADCAPVTQPATTAFGE
ncbi:MAG TPA: TauD/TfdA family dioxygenase [Pseudonocardiaceae bacterium]|nr:TauD/TfdA family dioxygenase [Pseudonocardiaceae bacterium]